MADPRVSAPQRRWARWVTVAAGAAVVGLVVTLAIVWDGYDARETPLEDASVWALQTGEGRRYAKVNTALGELETVKAVENPSGIAQHDGRVLVFTDADARFADISPAAPPELDADSDADLFAATPPGTVDVVPAGDYVAFRTDAGDVFAGRLSTGGGAVPVDPFADVQTEEGEERPRLRADAVTVTPEGTVFAVSSALGLLVTADAATGEVREERQLDIEAGALQLTAVGARWAAFDAEDGTMWLADRDEPIALDTGAGAVVQQPSASGARVLIADAAGLLSIDLDSAEPQRTLEASGAPAAPAVIDGVAYAAWLGTQGGTLWSSEDGEAPLDYGGLELNEDVSPAFAVNGRRGILNDTASGWVWTLPGGDLVPSSQQWEGEDTTQQDQDQQVESERVIDPKPPVAVPDVFGVRAGHDVLLPVLLNDHDPNEDVLSIVPESLTGLDPGFGSVRSTNEDQQLVVSVAADAAGSASFSYRVTDGTTADGLLSEPATVTLTVAGDDVNTPPVWCGVEGCLATWPAPQVAPGSTTTVDVLDGWVDPEGDPIYLASATNTSGAGSLAADPAGSVTYQHPDPQAAEATTATIDLVVADARGATAARALSIDVVPSPELLADSFTVTGAIGAPVTVDVGAHVTGGTGALSLTAARALDEGAVTVTPNPAALTFTVTGETPGSYTVQYTVRAASGEATALARITLLDPATTQISTPPLTAFVRPSEDATVDVLSAVHNPAGLVLLTSDLRPEPVAGAALSADAVDQNLVRVSGGTDDGQPGTLGVVRYTVSDGTGNAAGTTSGELTVVLLPASTAEPPIAVDDAVTVRAGAQIDIPALANDTAPASAVISIDPSKVVNESGAGLAFATPRQVRYLAPQEAGSYSLSYTVYRLGFPEMTDTARIFITVLPTDENTAPAPKDLVGRVLSGSSVEIPFDGYALDPDGDGVRLDRVVDQPAQGSAAVSADGTALVYTSAPGSSGQDAFTFRVRDGRGATGTATVRVGVLNASSDPRPVTYSDYTQAQAGEESEVLVRPADNDVDPAGSRLELLDVRPYAAAESPEYDAVRDMLLDVDTETGAVRIGAGTTLGTFSFVYTVRNRTGDTAQGLLVLKVVREAVPDYPVVADTRLTSETREQLADGVDVIDGKVAWTTGDAADLELRLWGEQEDYRARGHRISGDLPAQTSLVPFEVRGTSFDGREVVSYGFLHIPGEDELTLTLRSTFADVRVDENGSVEVDMADAVAVPDGATLQVSAEGLAAGGGRPEARCTHVGGTTVRYDAGAGAPWTDVCTVPVRLSSQDEDTFLPLPITVVAEAPQPELRPASVSVSPGDELVYELSSMTSWEGQRDWSGLRHATSYAGDQFTVTQNGGQLSIVAADTARPGRTEPVVVSLPSHPEAAAATLTLTVGPAPATLPKGATVTERCSQGGGSTSCTITVVGRGGEVNPLPRTPLVLTDVTSPANCPGVTFSRASDTAVTASWVGDAPGAGSCQGSFTVQDAQQRSSSGDRNGTVILDLQGLPANAARVNWVGYTGDSVSLRVVSEASSYPAVTGYRVRGSNGTEVTCSASGECPAIPARNGEQIAYQAWAVNGVGESRQAVGTTAWAYRPPAAPTSMASVPIGDQTARITVGIGDPTTRDVRLRIGATEVAAKAVGGASSVSFDVNVGTNTGVVVTAVPTTSFTVPPASVVAGGSAEGQTASVEAWGVGAPGLVLAFTDRDVSGFSADVVVSAVVQTPNARDAELRIGFARGNERCTPSTTVAGVTGSAESAPYRATLWIAQTYRACAVYVVDGRPFETTTVSGIHAPTGDIPPPTGDREYTITLDGRDGDAQRTARLTKLPGLVVGDTREYEIRYAAAGVDSTDVRAVLEGLTSATPVTARTCLIGDAGTCSSTVQLVATDAPFRVQVTFPRTCGEMPTVVHPGSDTPITAWAFTAPTFADPVAVVTFREPLRMLGSTTRTYGNCVDPNPPTPTPTPTPTEPAP